MSTEIPSIFISHSNHDKAMVRRIAEDLRSRGVIVWLDEWEIKVGHSITLTVQAGIKECQFVGVWLTKNAVESHWVELEWTAKYNEEVSKGRVSVLPLLAEDCEIPSLLCDKKYADFRTEYDLGLRELFSVLLPNDELFRRAIQNIRHHTSDLWENMRWLPINRATSLTCEIRISTLAKIEKDLNTLSIIGRFFDFKNDVEYQMVTGEDVHALKFNNINQGFYRLINESQ
jgi:hypothetical protein